MYPFFPEGPGYPIAKYARIVDPWGQDFTVALEHDAQLRTIIQILYMQALLKANKVRTLPFFIIPTQQTNLRQNN